jgi:hypothetical protein
MNPSFPPARTLFEIGVLAESLSRLEPDSYYVRGMDHDHLKSRLKYGASAWNLVELMPDSPDPMKAP